MKQLDLFEIKLLWEYPIAVSYWGGGYDRFIVTAESVPQAKAILAGTLGDFEPDKQPRDINCLLFWREIVDLPGEALVRRVECIR